MPSTRIVAVAVAVSFIGFQWTPASSANRLPAKFALQTRAVQPAVHRAATSKAYVNSVMGDHPTVFYRLDERAGKTAHDTADGRRHNLTFAAGVKKGLSGPLMSDPSAHAAGGATTIASGTVTSLPAGNKPRTLEAWVREPNWGSGHCCSPNALVVSYGNAAKAREFGIGLNGPFNPSLFVEANGNKEVSQPAPYAVYQATSEWHLIDATYSNGFVSLYLDGQRIGMFSIAVSTQVAGGKLIIGGWPGVADVATYPSALTFHQIDSHWSAAASPTGKLCALAPASAYDRQVLAKHPDVFYPLDDRSSGRVAYDASGNCFNAAYSETSSPTSGPLSSAKQKAVGDASEIVAAASDTELPYGTQARTIEAWVREPNSGTGGCCSPTQLIASYGNTDAGRGFTFGYQGNYNPLLTVTASSTTITQAVPIDAYAVHSRWNLVDVTVGEGVVSLYFDGQIIRQAHLQAKTELGEGLRIGEWPGVADVAIYPGTLSNQMIDNNWSTGASTTGAVCAKPDSTPYGDAVRQDHASLFYSLSDRDSSRVLYDRSGYCRNGAYDSGARSVSGPLLHQGASHGVLSDGFPVALGDSLNLPSYNAPRTIEVWMKQAACCSSATALQYGDVAGGHGFSVGFTGGTNVWVDVAGEGGKIVKGITPMEVRDGPAPIDASWHLVDVTLKKSHVTIYLDGQIIETGKLKVTTSTPGSGLVLGGNGLSYADQAIYPNALSTAQIDRHWVLARLGSKHTCADAQTGLYSNDVAATKPVVFYPLDDVTPGRVAHDSGGSCRYGAFWAPDQVAGPIATEDGASEGVNSAGPYSLLASGNGLPSGSHPRTIEFWVKVPQFSGGTVLAYGDAEHQRGFTISINMDTVVVHGNGNSQVTFDMPPHLTIDDGNWHFVNIITAGDEVLLRMDGQFIAAEPLSIDTSVPGQGLGVSGCCVSTADLAIYAKVLPMSVLDDQYAQSGAWKLASCGLSVVGLYGCFRTAADWESDMCVGVVGTCHVPDRPPDFVVFEASGGEGVDGSLSLAVSCDGNGYSSVGLGAALSALPVGAIAGFGYIHPPNSATEPSAAEVDNFLTGSTFSFTFGAGAGQQLLTSGGVDGVVYWGGLDASIGFSASYSFAMPGNHPSPKTRCGHGADDTSNFATLIGRAVAKVAPHEPKVTLRVSSGAEVAVQPGQSFYLAGTGFSPGTDVRVSYSADDPIGIAVANPQGDIGFSTRAPAKAGIAAIHAAGFTSSGVQRQLVAQIHIE